MRVVRQHIEQFVGAATDRLVVARHGVLQLGTERGRRQLGETLGEGQP